MIVCGTGHRPDKLGGYGEEVHDLLVDLALDFFTTGGGNKVSKVISGMALGWDQALADAAVRMNIPLVAAIPFEGQESRWPAVSRGRFNWLRSRAAEEVIVSEGGYAAWKMQVRNEWMVNNSDAVVALWNGTNGGTANCVRYAQRKDKPIINLWQEFEELKRR